MRKLYLIIVLFVFLGNVNYAQTWNILDKSMATWNQDDGNTNNQSWEIFQGGSAGSVLELRDDNNDGTNDYVNFTKTNTGSSARWAWVRPKAALTGIIVGQAYSIEAKIRVNALPDGATEANQFSLRLASTATTPIFLKYGDGVTGGSVSTNSGATNAYKFNTATWQTYRIVLRSDKKYDVYIAGIEDPIFEGALGGTNNDQNGIYFGAESQHRCNIDVAYVKVGTGDFFSKIKISSVTLSHDRHPAGSASTVAVTAKTAAIPDGKTLLFSLVNKNDTEIVAPVSATISNNTATANVSVPATVPAGQYYVKTATAGPINGVNVTPITIAYEVEDPVSAQTWDVLKRDFSVKPWNEFPEWALEKGGNVPNELVTQKDGYVNIYKTLAYGSGYYGFLISPSMTLTANTAYTYEVKARAHAIDKNQFPDVIKPSPGAVGGYEANQIGFLLNNKHMSVYIIYGDDNTGYIASPVVDGTGVSPSSTLRHQLNTSDWHVYRLIYNSDNTKYDVYVDGELVFEDIPLFNKTGANVSKIGGESWQRCNMDIEYVKIGTGDLVKGDKPRILSVELSSDSHIANNERTIQVLARTSFIENGEKLVASFTAEDGTEVLNSTEMTINANQASFSLTIPATVPLGKYVITINALGGKIGEETVQPKSMQYVVVDVSPIDTKMLPQVKAVDYIKQISDYTYKGPSQEFIFPSIVDTKKNTVNGKFKNGQTPIDRYYLFYSPHENPGGMYLSTAPTLDGPWTEYDGTQGMSAGTVIDYNWAVTQSDIIKNGAENHISACQVVWNEVQDKYIMYFHGPNTTTHYATSDDLVNWTFGASILVSNQFSPLGAEASYAKAFKHEIPGLDNKYVIMLMNQENQIRRIYWAHSKDGINWTPVTKPLVSPDLYYKKVPGTDRKPNFDGGGGGAYGNNASGPFLMVRDGRYFVICHDSADNLMVIEVGEAFDMEVHWGEYMTAADVLLFRDGQLRPTRPAAVDFIQDDNGKWYMFFEAGGRLDANIAYAKEGGANAVILPSVDDISVYPTMPEKGENMIINAGSANKVTVEIIDLSGNRLSSVVVNGSMGSVQAPVNPGLYFIKRTTDENLVKTSKIIVR